MPTVVLKSREVVDAQHISVSLRLLAKYVYMCKTQKEKTRISRSINAVKEPR